MQIDCTKKCAKILLGYTDAVQVRRYINEIQCFSTDMPYYYGPGDHEDVLCRFSDLFLSFQVISARPVDWTQIFSNNSVC